MHAPGERNETPLQRPFQRAAMQSISTSELPGMPP
jgi:hypothetical protein